jgi:hypothetical protein
VDARARDPDRLRALLERAGAGVPPLVGLLLASLLLLALGATSAAASAQQARGARADRVVAREFVRAEVGGFVRAHTGESIFVPPGVLAHSGYVTITARGRGVYDVHIAVPWHGTVAVSIPLRRKTDTILHDVGGVWLAEGQRAGQRTVWVTQLSWFTTLVSKAVDKVTGALCLSFSLPAIAQCVLEKVGAHVDGKLVSWIESKLPQNCVAQLAEAGVTSARGGPAAIILAIMKQAESGSCVGSAGEVGFKAPPNTPSPATGPSPSPAPTPSPVPAPTPGPTPGPPPQTWSEQETPNHPVNTFTDYHNASGEGPAIAAGLWVQVSCKVYDPTIGSVNPDGYWYRIASAPWDDAYYSPANTFMNGDPYGGPYTHNTDFNVPDC